MPSKRNLLLTGPFGVGKSTLLRNVGRSLPTLNIRGFHGDIIWDGPIRLGWRLDTYDDKDGGVLIHRDMNSEYRMGRYGVDMPLFERLVASELQLAHQADVYLVDEIGIVASWSPNFEQAITALFDSPYKVVAIVRLKNETFSSQVKHRPDVDLWHVIPENREALAPQLRDWILSESPSASGQLHSPFDGRGLG